MTIYPKPVFSAVFITIFQLNYLPAMMFFIIDRMGRNGVIVEMTTDETETAERGVICPRDRQKHSKKFAEDDEEVKFYSYTVPFFIYLFLV